MHRRAERSPSACSSSTTTSTAGSTSCRPTDTSRRRSTRSTPLSSYRQAAQLFWNAGDGSARTFELVDPESTGDLGRPIVGRGSSYADLDGDGDLDIVITQVGGPPLLLRNDQATGHHWVRVELVDRAPGREALGAWVTLTAGGATQRRQVAPSRSYLAQVELALTFGLGTVDSVERLEVTWPDGTVQSVSDVGIDRLHVIEREPAG